MASLEEPDLTLTLVTCPPSPRRDRALLGPYVEGFTLLELLVVLVIMGMLTALVLPRLRSLEQSSLFYTQQQSLLHDLGRISYLAYSRGHDLTLSNQVISRSVLEIPDGWRVVFPHPILVDFNGFCSGGDVELTPPGDRPKEVWHMQSPTCALQPLQHAP
ncbi:MAG: prepilin-type N-terminal cleavage/methylation domain-containing protein [Pseudomonadales bacterium]|nr:prepilin-type N-terminal cleavage/methylation domain-containing protein [Pseudomonadales bacterium]